MPLNFITPDMGLTEPTIGVTYSPTWAMLLNANFGIIDSHTHQPGSGVQITPAGMNINTDLSFQDNNAFLLRSVRFDPQSVPLTLGTDVGCLYEAGVDLYYNDGNGNQIRLTASGGIAGTPGSIAGLTPPASATYVSATDTFVWESNSGVAANMDAATYILRYPSTGYPSPSGSYIALEAPSTLATGYSFIFPTTLPSITSLLQLSSAGQLSASNSVPNITTSQITLGSGGPTISPSSSDVALSGGLLAGTGGSVLAGAGGTMYPSGASEASIYANTSAVFVTSTAAISYPLVVSATPATTGLLIVRGAVTSSGTVAAGEGFSVSHPSTGIYDITLSTAFLDVPVVVVSPGPGAAAGIPVATGTVSSTGFVVAGSNSTGTAPENNSFSFIAIGQRSD